MLGLNHVLLLLNLLLAFDGFKLIWVDNEIRKRGDRRHRSRLASDLHAIHHSRESIAVVALAGEAEHRALGFPSQ